MKLEVTLEREESGGWIAECPAIEGCFSRGKTKEQALENIKEGIENSMAAMAIWLEVPVEEWLPVTIEVRQIRSPTTDKLPKER